ncbi:MAG: DNA mismatch repair endonuclease MutL [Spirochaetales bacterium]
MNREERSARGPIKVLPETVARKIAAGEVIERPASVIRELIDNSIDAGAGSISVEIAEGGLRFLRVTDDGIGMDDSDLDHCYLSHSTSKVRTADDLIGIESLGFRGEALSSVASVSTLEIASRTDAGAGGRRTIEEGREVERGAPKGTPGTVVQVRRLFYNFPARKRFLKRPATESAMCRQVFVEKALAHPGISFKLIADNTVKLVLPPSSFRQRVVATHDAFSEHQLHTIDHEGVACEIKAVVGTPELARRNRGHIQVFVNGRRIKEFGFVQAVEYALGDRFHGGTFPVAFLFLSVPPEHVDFNIHPAKLEAKFEHRERIHHDIVTALRSQGPTTAAGAESEQTLTAHESAPFDRTARPQLSQPKPARDSQDLPFAARSATGPDPRIGTESGRHQVAAESYRRIPGDFGAQHPESADATSELTFHGQAFGVFLIIESTHSLYLIDQHAAHERIMYDYFRRRGSKQPLLVPIDFEVDTSQAQALRDRSEHASSLGIDLTEESPGRFRISSVPESFRGSESLLAESLTGLEVISGEFERDLYATMACKAALRGGDHVDSLTAVDLAERALSLPEPRCPHGRPLWYTIRRDDLFSAIGRT